MHDPIADPWGERTPYGRGEPWPVRVDEAGATAGATSWAQTASVLHSNGDGYDIAVRDGRIAGVRGRAKKKPVGRYTYLKWLDDGDVAPCMVEVYEIEVTEIDAKFKERGQRELAWLSREEAAYRVREVELKSLIIDFKPKRK